MGFGGSGFRLPLVCVCCLVDCCYLLALRLVYAVYLLVVVYCGYVWNLLWFG